MLFIARRCRMKPKLMKNKADLESVGQSLQRFYCAKPIAYVRDDQQQSAFEAYADIVVKYSSNVDGIIVDFGCGTWRGPHTMKQRGLKQVFGVDYFEDTQFAEAMQKAHLKGVHLRRYDGKTLPFETGSVSTVASLCVFEHVVRVQETLEEIDRILEPGGTAIILCPNWSGVNNPIRGIQSLCSHGDRYWQYETIFDCLVGIFRSFTWYLMAVLRRKPEFLMVFPRMRGTEIDFERGDDDVVHLCQPVSFKKFFKMRNYQLIVYNRVQGDSILAKVFNTMFPSMATSNTIIARKNKNLSPG